MDSTQYRKKIQQLAWELNTLDMCEQKSGDSLARGGTSLPPFVSGNGPLQWGKRVVLKVMQPYVRIHAEQDSALIARTSQALLRVEEGRAQVDALRQVVHRLQGDLTKVLKS